MVETRHVVLVENEFIIKRLMEQVSQFWAQGSKKRSGQVSSAEGGVDAPCVKDQSLPFETPDLAGQVPRTVLVPDLARQVPVLVLDHASWLKFRFGTEHVFEEGDQFSERWYNWETLDPSMSILAARAKSDRHLRLRGGNLARRVVNFEVVGYSYTGPG
ncbi:hypothetical protein K438DRAFT_1773555 [Mycena galopus ATCC 62051]|nr:hypothetical protein K438DRAFT_1773555 [Mycena galopus ATCC 62051]